MSSVPCPRLSSPGGKFALGVEVLPRNFLGGLSRSPAAGSTTQRSSTSLGDKELGQWERRDISPHSTPPSGQGVPGYQGGLQRNLSVTDEPLTIKSLPFQAQWLKDRISWGGMVVPRKNHRDKPSSLQPPGWQYSCPMGFCCHSGPSNTEDANSYHNPEILLSKPERAVCDGGGREKETKRNRKKNKEQGRVRAREGETEMEKIN